jgi:hypothetical protein
VSEAGKQTAATALLFTTVSDRLPWARLSSIAKAHVADNSPLDEIFAEHWRRLQTVPSDEWEDACRKALKKKAGLFDSHPSLRERLKAIGISPKEALKWIRKQSGPPARDLFPDWPVLEKILTDELMALYRQDHFAKRELAQIILRRPR